MIKADRAELQIAAEVGAVIGGVTGYLLSRKRRMAQKTYLGAHWCTRRHWHGFLSLGLSFVNASPHRFSPPWFVVRLKRTAAS